MRKIKFLLILIVLMGIYIVIENNTFSLNKKELTFKDLPDNFDGYKILHLSDLHGKEYGDKNKRLIKSIKKSNPDIIVMTGDMISSRDKDFEVLSNLVKEIKELPIYYITGNHEQYLSSKKLNSLKNELKNFGVVVLDNEKVKLKKGNENINLYGLIYPNHFYRSGNYLDKEDIDELLGPIENEFSILLSHNPFHFEGQANWGADLILSGHVHGGMIRVPIIGGLLSPEYKFFPKYYEGVYEKNNKKMFVSRGMGIGEVGFRVFNRPEIILITLKKG